MNIQINTYNNLYTFNHTHTQTYVDVDTHKYTGKNLGQNIKAA